MTVAEQHREQERASDWPERIDVLLFVRPDGDHWSALSLDFDVAGMGDTDHAAIDNALELLCDYLSIQRAEGKSFADTRRPVPVLHQVRLIGRAVVDLLRARMATARRDRVSLPLNGGARFAG